MSTKRSRLKQQPEPVLDERIDDENDEFSNMWKIRAPVVWGRIPVGYEIRDIMESEYEAIKQFIIEWYMPNHLLCKNANILEDDESVKEMIDAFMFILKDKCSICVIEEETQTLVAVAILRVIDKKCFGKVYSRIQFINGEAYKKIKKAYNYLNRKSDLFTKFNCDNYLRCYMLAVHDDYRKKGIGLQLLRASIDVARSLNVPVIMGIFPTNNLQRKAKKIGLEVVHEIYYVDWVEKGEIIFSDPGPGNYTLNLMAGKVPPLK